MGAAAEGYMPGLLVASEEGVQLLAGGWQADAWYRLQVNRNIAGPLALVAQCHCQPSRDGAHPAFVMQSSLALHPD